MLNIENLSFDYEKKKVLEDINMYIAENDFLGIIGPNGSGKSTLLKNISRIISPNKGIIYIDGEKINKYSNKELAKKMAVVPQDTNVQFNFTVYDIIMMGRNPYQGKWGKTREKDTKIVREVMEHTDTFRLQDKKVNQLSGGERQRVIIARALAQKPDLLLLDEPTSSLDINYQGEIFDLLSNLNKELSLTVIVVSHDLNLSGQYCDNLILLSEGKIFVSGSPEYVLSERNIKEVYNTEVIVKENTITSRPYVTLIPKNYQKENTEKKKKGRIHVIGGGGSARELLKRLDRVGYKNISCGVLNQGDRDWEIAKKLNLDIVEIPPFDYVGKESSARNKERLKKADIVIITDTPFGHGNIGNLKAVAEIENKKIILQIGRNFSKRDYTGGNAEKYWDKIAKKGFSFSADTVDDILKRTEELLN